MQDSNFKSIWVLFGLTYQNLDNLILLIQMLIALPVHLL